MAEPADHWLALGSNVDGEDRLTSALERMARIGQLHHVSAVLTGPDASGGPRPYRNQLVCLRSALTGDDLIAALKTIERQGGRSAERMAQGLCDLDIDLLARHDPQTGMQEWSEKPLRIPAVRRLAEQAGLLPAAR
ncbi:MAG: 2-amino-4-hydroxy-6-hydroxymethyldihydropteridine diphosphokinase [Lysobacteraceae bacterium]|jgi:2-amino-4-hydroxy-6-hydroxymethyldihydropteridine diphosphokinase